MRAVLLSSPLLNKVLRRYCVCVNANKNTKGGIAGLKVPSIALPPNVIGYSRPSRTRLHILSPDGQELEDFLPPADPKCRPEVLIARIRAHARAFGVRADPEPTRPAASPSLASAPGLPEPLKHPQLPSGPTPS